MLFDIITKVVKKSVKYNKLHYENMFHDTEFCHLLLIDFKPKLLASLTLHFEEKKTHFVLIT